MNLARSGLTWTHCFVCLDDITIWAPTFEEDIYRLRLVFDRIGTTGLKLKPTKCQFLRNEVTFLGHVVSPKGIKLDPEKAKAVKTCPAPLDVLASLVIIGESSLDFQLLLSLFMICAGTLYHFGANWNKNLPLRSSSFAWLVHQY